MNVSKSLIGKVIINFLALALLWMIVKAALSAHEITKKVTEPIFKLGETIAKSAPLPVPGLGKMPIGQAGNIIPQVTNTIESAARSAAMEPGNKFGSSLAGAMGYAVDEASKKFREAAVEAVKVK